MQSDQDDILIRLIPYQKKLKAILYDGLRRVDLLKPSTNWIRET